jgi:hypothetical protein
MAVSARTADVREALERLAIELAMLAAKRRIQSTQD